MSAAPRGCEGSSKDAIRDRVDEAQRVVKLDGFGDRYPRELSGGKQQRIALARAVVFDPLLLLMDEPLGALDRKLREALQLEIMRVSRERGATVLYVTHDQEEALVMSDRIAIFNQGRIEQIGSGEDLYDRPATLFVAEFIGESNIIRGRFERDGGAAGWVVREPWRCLVGPASVQRAEMDGGTAVGLVVRPERMRILAPADDAPSGVSVLDGIVDEALYLGSDRKYGLSLADGQHVTVREQRDGNERVWTRGDTVRVAWSADDAVLLPDPAG